MDEQKKQFKISNLDAMTSSDLDGNDLFLVSDVDATSTKKSKKLDFKTLNDSIANSTQIENKISSNIEKTLEFNILDGGGAF